MKSLATSALAGALVLASGAWAQETATLPIYLGASYGQAHWRPGCPDSAACDDTNSALRVLAGYQINRMLAAEVGFHNLGKATGGGASIKANAWELVAVAAWPLTGALSVYGKLGAYRGNAEGSGTLLGAREANYSGTWGLGLALELHRQLVLRGEWQSYPNLASGSLGPRSDVNVISAGALWRFQ